MAEQEVGLEDLFGSEEEEEVPQQPVARKPVDMKAKLAALAAQKRKERVGFGRRRRRRRQSCRRSRQPFTDCACMHGCASL